MLLYSTVGWLETDAKRKALSRRHLAVHENNCIKLGLPKMNGSQGSYARLHRAGIRRLACGRPRESDFGFGFIQQVNRAVLEAQAT